MNGIIIIIDRYKSNNDGLVNIVIIKCTDAINIKGVKQNVKIFINEFIFSHNT